MDLINQFIENYKKKMNFYETAGRMAARQLESALQAAGIRAIVTSRAKSPGASEKQGPHTQFQAGGPL